MLPPPEQAQGAPGGVQPIPWPPTIAQVTSNLVKSAEWGFLFLLLGTAMFEGAVWSFYSRSDALGLLGIIAGWVSRLLVLGGVLLVVEGRRPFGRAHGWRALVGLIFAAASFGGGILFEPVNGPMTSASFEVFLLTVALLFVIDSLVAAFLTDALLKRVGRLMVWMAPVSTAVILWYEYSVLVGGLFPNPWVDLLNADQLLTIPGGLQAAAYFLVWIRIRRREIP